MIDWNESKRKLNLVNHGIDLAELEAVFDSPMVTVEDSRERYGEARLQSLGLWRAQVVFLVWTPRGDDTAHLISCRYANRQETKRYFSYLT
ncbi:MAG: BrnT family toxin [Casimicrobium sp.]